MRLLLERYFSTFLGRKLTNYLQLLSGTAELFGTELPIKQTYTFTGTKAAIYTWHGCRIEVVGDCQVDYVAEETPMMVYGNLHFALENLREKANSEGREGPRVLIVGSENAGKTSLAKILTAYATKLGRQPVVVNLDTKEGMLSIPGTLSAATFTSVVDVEHGWGSSPMNGPSQVPVKLPLVYHIGLANPEEKTFIYKPVVTRLALSVMNRLQDDDEAKETGVIIDTPGVISQGKSGYEMIQHIVSEFLGMTPSEGTSNLEQPADLSGSQRGGSPWLRKTIQRPASTLQWPEYWRWRDHCCRQSGQVWRMCRSR